MSYTKTIWNNGETPINSENLNKIENELETLANNCDTLEQKIKKNILSFGLSTNFVSTASEYIEINTWTENIKFGTKLKIENGKIKIGADVSTIKITGQIGVLTKNIPERYYFWTRINGSNVGTWIVVDDKNDYNSIPFNQILNVSEGDVISIAVYTNHGSTLEASKTVLLAEVVD